MPRRQAEKGLGRQRALGIHFGLLVTLTSKIALPLCDSVSSSVQYRESCLGMACECGTGGHGRNPFSMWFPGVAQGCSDHRMH